MTKHISKHLATVSLILLGLFLLTGNLYSEETLVEFDTSELILGRFPKAHKSRGGSATRSYGDYPEVETALVNGWMNFDAQIDLTKHKIPVADFSSVYFGILNRHGECFHVAGSYGIYSSSGKVTKAIPNYTLDNNAEYAEMRQSFNAASARALAQISPDMTDLEKALVLHDYLAANCEYDYTYSKRDAYTALVLKSAVCEGYTIGYAYLLRQAGVPCDSVSSEDMNHAWNVVQIDSQWYHVDVTWDDTQVNDGFNHINFLISDTKIEDNDGHSAHYGWDKTAYGCTSTRFDDYFWRNACYGFLPVIDHKVYAIMTSDVSMYAYNAATGEGTRLAAIPNERWNVWGGSGFWKDKYNQLALYRGMILFNGREAVYIFNTVDNSYSAIDVDLPDTGYCYGLTVTEGESLKAIIKTSPNEMAETYFPIPWVDATGITVSPTEQSYVTTGTQQEETLQLTATLIPNGATCQIINWSSDNEDVATVSNDGLVTVKLAATGSATITATSYDGGFQDQCVIDVHNPVYTIAVEALPANGGTVTGGGTYEKDTAFTLTATPEDDYKFIGWYIGEELVSEEAEYEQTAQADATYTAHFIVKNIQIDAVAEDPAMGNVTGAGVYPNGSAVTLTATPALGHDFIGWFVDNELFSNNLQITFNATAPMAFTARFQSIPYGVETTIGHGWNLIGLPLEPDAACSELLHAECLFLVNTPTGTPQRVQSDTPLTAGTPLWLYNPGSPRVIQFTGTCSQQRAFTLTKTTFAVTPFKDSILPDEATLQSWGAFLWNASKRCFQPAGTLLPGQAVFLANPPEGDILPVQEQ